MNPDLDDRLSEAAPPLEHVPDLQPAIVDLVAATRLTRPRRRASRRGVLISTTTAGIVLVGTAAAAALGIGGWTTPWGQDPDGTIEFTLPSGIECELRFGNLYTTTSPERVDELREWLDDRTLDQIADIEGALETTRAEDQIYTRENGEEVVVGYGTPYYDADYEYFWAVIGAVNTAVSDRAVETGILKDGGSMGLAAEDNCTGGWQPDASTWLP